MSLSALTSHEALYIQMVGLGIRRLLLPLALLLLTLSGAAATAAKRSNPGAVNSPLLPSHRKEGSPFTAGTIIAARAISLAALVRDGDRECLINLKVMVEQSNVKQTDGHVPW